MLCVRSITRGRGSRRWRRPYSQAPRYARDRGHEVRRHLGRLAGRHQARRAPDRRRSRGRQAGGRRALGAWQDDRRAGRRRLRDLRPPARARDGHAALDRRADLVRALRDGDPRHRPPGDLAHRLAGGDRHRLLAHQGADPRRARRSHPHRRCARTGSCSSPASRASPATASTSPRSGAAARTRPRSRSPTPLGAEVCEIYTDVAGVFSADPRMVPDARKLKLGLVRRDARDVVLGRRGAAAARGRVRPQPRRPHPLPQFVRRRPRYSRALRERDHGTPAGHSRHPRLRGARHPHRAQRRARRGRLASSARSPTRT